MPKKKKGRYIHSEKDVDDHLLQIGLSDITLRDVLKDKIFEDIELKNLVEKIHLIESFISRIEKKGLSFKEFLAAKNEDGYFPKYRVEVVEGYKYAYNKQDFEKIK